MRLWPRDEPLPRLRGAAAAIALAGALAATFAFTQVARGFGAEVLAHRLIPNDQFPRTLAEQRRQAPDLLARFPRDTAHIDPERVRRARTFAEFDQCLTAPLHGFADADDYYRRSSALPFLARITVPTLCLSAEDDPFFPGDAVHRARDASSAAVRFEITKWGGHTGFVSGSWPWRASYWAEEQAVEWLVHHARTGA